MQSLWTRQERGSFPRITRRCEEMAYGNYSLPVLRLIAGTSLLSEPSGTNLQAVIARAFKLEDFPRKQYPRHEKPITGECYRREFNVQPEF